MTRELRELYWLSSWDQSQALRLVFVEVTLSSFFGLGDVFAHHALSATGHTWGDMPLFACRAREVLLEPFHLGLLAGQKWAVCPLAVGIF